MIVLIFGTVSDEEFRDTWRKRYIGTLNLMQKDLLDLRRAAAYVAHIPGQTLDDVLIIIQDYETLILHFMLFSPELDEFAAGLLLSGGVIPQPELLQAIGAISAEAVENLREMEIVDPIPASLNISSYGEIRLGEQTFEQELLDILETHNMVLALLMDFELLEPPTPES